MIAPESLPPSAALGLSALVHLESTPSTMDEVHQRARDGAPAGLLVIADRQRAGRGRSGNAWTSEAGAGLWMTLLERPSDAASLRVLSLRVGLALASALEPFVDGRVMVKWPNDVYLHAPGDGSSSRKLAGILIEARWREAIVEWVAIGIGINLRAAHPSAAALRPGTSRDSVLRALMHPLRRAVHGAASLSVAELDAWHRRDLSIGREIVGPVRGRVHGVTDDGAIEAVDALGNRVTANVGSVQYAAGDSPVAHAT